MHLTRRLVPAAVVAAVVLATIAAVGPSTAAAAPALAADVVPVAPRTTIGSTPLPFSRTDGDILTITKVVGSRVPAIAIGGNFRHVITSDGKWHLAKNFAVLNAKTGAVLYAGNANSYVRAITSYGGNIYLGGDFTTFRGAPRRHVAAVNVRYQLMAWRPSTALPVRALASDRAGVYIAGDFGTVVKIPLVKGRTIWTKAVRGGSGRALLLFQGGLFVGGLFQSYAGVTRHGLVRVNPANGVMVRSFSARLRANTGVGASGDEDGEEVLALTARGRTEIVVGMGGRASPGHASNEIYVKSARTGATYWRRVLVGDCQAVAVAGATAVAGYHRNTANTTTPYPNFGAQFNEPTGDLTTWDPRLTGIQSNADGGNNGVQAMLADPVTKTLYVAGAFTQWNGSATGQSLVAFRWS